MRHVEVKAQDVISVIGAASGLGQPLRGLENAPDFLWSQDFMRTPQFKNLGTLTAPPGNDPCALFFAIKSLALQAMARGERVLTLGGDHSVAIGSIAATLTHSPQSRVVWVDAHGDMNTPYSSTTGNLHGMPLAALMGLFKNPVVTEKLNPRNLILLGTRDLDSFEREMVEALQIEIVTARDIENKFDASLQRLQKWLIRNQSPVHLSFDVDALDPQDAPSTGLHVPQGLSMLSAIEIVRQVRLHSNLIAVDLVEFNPSIGSTIEIEKTVQNLSLILNECFNLKTGDQAYETSTAPDPRFTVSRTF